MHTHARCIALHGVIISSHSDASTRRRAEKSSSSSRLVNVIALECDVTKRAANGERKRKNALTTLSVPQRPFDRGTHPHTRARDERERGRHTPHSYSADCRLLSESISMTARLECKCSAAAAAALPTVSQHASFLSPPPPSSRFEQENNHFLTKRERERIMKRESHVNITTKEKSGWMGEGGPSTSPARSSPLLCRCCCDVRREQKVQVHENDEMGALTLSLASRIYAHTGASRVYLFFFFFFYSHIIIR